MALTTVNRVDRATYDTLKANCAAKINAQLVALNLTPSKVQELSMQAVMEFTQLPREEQLRLPAPASISLMDMYHYRNCQSLPREAKLAALAKVLKCHPDDLVPKKYQGKRLTVARRAKAATPDGKVNVLPFTEPGYSILQIEGVLPTEQCYKVAAMLVKHINFHTYKRGRPELSDAEVTEHLAALAANTE